MFRKKKAERRRQKEEGRKKKAERRRQNEEGRRHSVGILSNFKPK